MVKHGIIGLAMAAAFFWAGAAMAQHEHGTGQDSGQSMGGMMMHQTAMPMNHPQQEGMHPGNCLQHTLGASYQVKNLKDGVLLTITHKDPAQVQKLQAAAKRFSEIKDVSDKDEMVTCPVQSTKIKKSQAYDTAVYKGTTYYFCCAMCKPEFLKDPEKYIKQMEQKAAQ